ncbi:MAG: 3'-5' exonuclease [Epsilonproteobacteria bacterium]|nr:3'-5' exonuclease [Campylobacterota bacterium]
MKYFDTLVEKIKQNRITKEFFFDELKSIKSLEDIDVEDIENLRLLGLPLLINGDNLALKTSTADIRNQKFCIVDIEANGSKPNEFQIIEIGAVMIQNGAEIDRLETFVQADLLPESITILTGITLGDLKDAPPLGLVLEKFRLFLGDAVFIAHNVNFDYSFISASLQKAGFGPLLNRKLCTIELSRKCFVAQKYGLGFLMEFFDVSFGEQHRALVDARMADYVFKQCLSCLPNDITTTEELIEFSRPPKKKKKKKKVSG